MNEINPDNALRALRDDRCGSMMGLETLLVLSGGVSSPTEIGERMNVLPSSITNVFRNLLMAQEPLVERCQEGYQLTPHGEAVLSAAKTFFSRLDNQNKK
tara:strand:+ start:3438 stop:3737 length:300 start_codon:yes stop_codon:yes gene_type:complete